MTTRRDKTVQSNFSVDLGLELGSVPDYKLESCTVEDLDRAVYKLFKEDLPLYFKDGNKGEMKRIPVIFATGERFSILNRDSPIRDEAGSLILPIISVNRGDIAQGQPIGPGQNAPIKIVRRLSEEDPIYQSLVNKPGLKNQDNVASPKSRSAKVGSLSTRRQVYGGPAAGITLGPQAGPDNMYEVITIPPTKRYRVTYNIAVWCNYMQQVNDVISVVMSSYHNNNGREFRVESPKGYWFTVRVQDNFSQGSNFDNFGGEERIVKTEFSLEGEGYVINPDAPGQGIALRRFISAPSISFEVYEYDGSMPEFQKVGAPTGDPDDVTLQDHQTDIDHLVGQSIGGYPAIAPLDVRGNLQNGESGPGKTTAVGGTQSGSSSDVVIVQNFNGKKQKARVTSRNRRKGETVIRIIEDFD